MGLGKDLFNKTIDIGKKLAKETSKQLNKTEPYKCKKCKKWTKYKSSQKDICRKCNKELNKEDYIY